MYSEIRKAGEGEEYMNRKSRKERGRDAEVSILIITIIRE